MAQYEDFIPENIAPIGTRRIGIYNRKGNRVGYIPLGNLGRVNMGEKLYSFGALSDIHIGESTSVEDYKRALSWLSQNVDFICECGDLVHGNATNAAAQIEQYKACRASATVPVYAIAGNHDGEYVSNVENVISNYTGQPLYYSIEQGNDAFVFVGVKSSTSGSLFTTAELQWLYETLEANRDKRCFLFQHVRPDDACGNALGIYTYDIWGGTEQTVFESLLRHYPNLIIFHGHSHLKFYMQKYSDLANYDKVFGCHSVHIPSLAVPRDTTSVVNPSITSVYAESEGYVVDVYENGIHLRGRDFVKGEFLPIASYWLNTTLQEVEAGAYVDETGTIVTRILPAGYTLLDYIESDGNQYIVTDYFPSSESRVIADLQFTSTGKQSRVFSAITDAYAFDFYINGNGKLAFNAGISRDNTATSVSANTTRHRYEIDCHTAKLDGAALKTLTASVGQCSHSLVLFARRTGGGEAITYLDSPTKAKIYSVKIYENGVLLRNYLPCINPDGEIGLYDTVTETFCGNEGTGEFVYGYAFVEYIESNGTQYIDTGFIPNTNSKMWLDFYPTVKQSEIFAGCRITNKDQAFTINSGGTKNANQFGAFGDSGNTVIGAHSVGRHTASIERGLFTYDGVKTVAAENAILSSTYSVYLFACNTNGPTLQSDCRIYACRLWDNGVLMRDFVPCVKHDGEAGMYDKVNGVFYGNAGTGSFTGA